MRRKQQTQGLGANLLAQFNNNYEALAEATGADIIHYPYPSRAYVVKNSAVLDRPTGYTREFLSFGSILARAQTADTLDAALGIMKSMQINNFNAEEISRVMTEIPYLKLPGNAALLKLAQGLASPSLPNDVRLASFRSAVALTSLARDAKTGTAGVASQQGASSAINDLVRALSENQNVSDKQKTDLLKRLADAVFDQSNPQGCAAIRAALVAKIEDIPPDFLLRAQAYLRNPIHKTIAVLGGALASTWVPLGLLTGDSTHLMHMQPDVAYAGLLGAVNPKNVAGCVSANMMKFYRYDQNLGMLAFGVGGMTAAYSGKAVLDFLISHL